MFMALLLSALGPLQTQVVHPDPHHFAPRTPAFQKKGKGLEGPGHRERDLTSILVKGKSGIRKRKKEAK